MSNVKMPRTPHITLPVKPEKLNKAKKLCKKLATLLFSEVCSLIITELMNPPF